MSHDTGHGHSKENVTIISFKNSFWLVVIIVGLFVAALNFVQAESHGEEGEGHGHHTEAAAGHGHGDASSHEAAGHQEAKEATQTNEGNAPDAEEHKGEETKPAEEAHH